MFKNHDHHWSMGRYVQTTFSPWQLANSSAPTGSTVSFTPLGDDTIQDLFAWLHSGTSIENRVGNWNPMVKTPLVSSLVIASYSLIDQLHHRDFPLIVPHHSLRKHLGLGLRSGFFHRQRGNALSPRHVSNGPVTFAYREDGPGRQAGITRHDNH